MSGGQQESGSHSDRGEVEKPAGQVGREESGLALDDLPDVGWREEARSGQFSQVRGYRSCHPWWQQDNLNYTLAITG